MIYVTKAYRRRANAKYGKSAKGKIARTKRRIRDFNFLKDATEKYYNAIARVAYYKTCLAIARIQNVPEYERHEIDTTN